MLRISWLSGWKCAGGLAWVFVLGLIGLTVAEISLYGGIVQFYGESLIFVWEVEEPQHHFRVYMTEEDIASSPPVEACTTLYSQEPIVEIETSPGRVYHLCVQAMTVAGDTSELSAESPLYLCMGTSRPSGSILPGETALGPSYPNPFNATTTIPFTIASSGGAPVAVSLQIYNTLGQVVRSLVEDERPPGQYRTVWDGRSDRGAIVSTGTYICLLRAGDYSSTRLLVFTK